MSDSPEKQPLTLDTYQAYVAESRYSETTGEPWERRYARLFGLEQLEFLNQHGAGLPLLLPDEFGMPGPEETKDLRYHMADELSDMGWFATDAVDRTGQRLADVCQQALRRYGRAGGRLSAADCRSVAL